MDEWFTTFFDEMANDFWDAAVPAEVTDAEVDYLRRTLRLERGSRVLDVPCGRGRHALPLARGGVEVVGLDISEDAVARLRQSAAREGVAVEVQLGDMRERALPRPVQAAYCMGNSVGYFDAGGVATFFAAVAAALEPGGRFVVDSSMVAEAVLPHLELEGTYEAGGITMTDSRRYDVRASRVDATVTFERDGARTTREMSDWVVTSGDLVRLLGGAGFDVEALHAGTDGAAFGLGSPRLLAVGRRRPATATG